MKKILLLFTSFLFTSNLTLFGADSFGAQADKITDSLNDLSRKANELLQQARILEGQIAEQRQGLKEPSRLRFYQELRNLWPELEEHVFVSRVAKLFVDNHISINTPTPPHWAEQDILNTLLSPESPLDSSPETKQKLKELLGKATILSDIQQKTADAEEFKKEAARLEKERKKLKKQLKKEAARLEKEAATRRAQEEAVKEAEKEKRKWDKFFGQGSKQEDQKPKTQEKQISQLVSLRAKPTSGAHCIPVPSAGQSKKQLRQELEQRRAQQPELAHSEMVDDVKNLGRQYIELSPSGKKTLREILKDDEDVQMFFNRLDAQLALEAEERMLREQYARDERMLREQYARVEQLEQQIPEQERLALLEHYRANLGSFIFHCSEYIKNNPKLTDQARQSLTTLITLLQGKIAASGQLTKADFLAMEQNSLLAEATPVMEEFPEFRLAIEPHFNTGNNMWNSILDGYKKPH